MKKFFKNLIWLVIIASFVGYFYLNKNEVKEVATAIEIYSKAITVSEFEYTEEFDINDVKVRTNNYYYEQLTDNQKTIYVSLVNGIKNLDNQIILKNYEYQDQESSLKDVEVALDYLCLDHPEIFYLNNNYMVSNITSLFGDKVFVEVSYSVSSLDELSEKVSKINSVIDEYLNEVTNKSTMEKEIILHDALAENVSYYSYENVDDIPDSCHTIEGAFLNSEAVCDGLSKALQVLLSNVDIKNIVVLGSLNETPHAWNKVKLEDKWYNLDITSDKSIKAENLDKIIIHSYFNVNDDYLESSYSLDNEEAVPKSLEIDDRYNYYIFTEKYISSNDNIDIKLSEIIKNNEDENTLEFCVDGEKDISNNVYRAVFYANKDDYLVDNQIKYYNIKNTYIIIKNK